MLLLSHCEVIHLTYAHEVNKPHSGTESEENGLSVLVFPMSMINDNLYFSMVEDMCLIIVTVPRLIICMYGGLCIWECNMWECNNF